MTEDLKALPDDLREVRRDADEKIEQAAEDRPALAWALDLRIPLMAGLLALLVAVIVRVLGVGFLPAFVLFLLCFAGAWVALTKVAAPRKPTRPL